MGTYIRCAIGSVRRGIAQPIILPAALGVSLPGGRVGPFPARCSLGPAGCSLRAGASPAPAVAPSRHLTQNLPHPRSVITRAASGCRRTNPPYEKYRAPFLSLLIILLGACLPIDWSALGDKLNPLPRSPRKVYEKNLRKNQPDSTYLWLGAAERALQTAALPEPPFRERGLLTADRPEAVGYRFRLAAGEALRFSLLPPFPAREVFGEVYRITGTTDSVEQFEEVAYWDSTTYRLEFEARRPGDYLFRLQEISLLPYPSIFT